MHATEEAYLARARDLLDRNRPDSAVTLLGEGLEAFPLSVPLRVRLGEALRRRGGLMSRLESARQLRTAVGFDDRSAQAHLQLALTYRDQGFAGYALAELDRALECIPDWPEAHLTAAEILLSELAFAPSPGRARQARAHLATLAGSGAPGALAAHYTAWSYYREGEPDSALAALRALGQVSAVPDSIATATAELEGLLEHDAGHFDRAARAFARLGQTADSATRFDFTDVRYLVSPGAYAALDSLAPAERADSVAAIWRWQDDDIATAVNERMVEYQARLAYADWNFATRRGTVPGRATRRGELYARFGPPTWSQRNFGGPDDFDLGVPTEIWAYESLPVPCTLAVVDEYLNGEYDFPAASRQARLFTGEPVSVDMPYIYADLIEDVPAEYPPLPDAGLKPRVTWARRRAPDSTTRLELFYAVAHPQLAFERYGDHSRASVAATLVLYGPRAREVARTERQSQFVVTPTLTVNPYLAVTEQLTLDGPPGRYRYVLHVQDLKSGTWGAVGGELELPDFRDSLALSDIVLAHDMGAPLGPARLGGLDYLPAFDAEFPRAGNLYIRHGIYNLALRGDRRNDYEETTELSALDRDRGILKKFAALLGAKTDTARVITTHRVRDFGTDAERSYLLDLSQYPPGRYLYTVRVRDLAADREVSSSVAFRLR
jgi:GWxTD domain-containing protein